jgi:sugar phosphate permease
MCAITCPTAWLSDLWGITYLTYTNHISVINASMVTSMLFLGTIIGSPLCGYLSDRVQNRKIPMIMGAFISLIVTVIIFNYQLHLTLLLLFFFLIGFFARTYSLGYSIAIEFNQKELLSTASGLINVIIVLGVSSFLSTYSALLSTMSEHHLGHKYTLAFWLLIVSFTISLIVALFLKDTDQAKNKLQNELLSKYV